MLQFACPYCRRSFNIAADRMGHEVACPACGGRILLSDSADAPQPPGYPADQPPLPPELPDVEYPEVPPPLPGAPPGTDLPGGSPIPPPALELPPGIPDSPVQMPPPSLLPDMRLPGLAVGKQAQTAKATGSRPIAVPKPRGSLNIQVAPGSSAQQQARRRLRKNLAMIVFGLMALVAMLMLLKEI